MGLCVRVCLVVGGFWELGGGLQVINIRKKRKGKPRAKES